MSQAPHAMTANRLGPHGGVSLPPSTGAPIENEYMNSNVIPGTTAGAVVNSDAAPRTVRMNKTIHVEIKGSLSQFSLMGPTAATWKPVQGKQISMFGSEDISGALDTAAPSGQQLAMNQVSPLPLGRNIRLGPNGGTNSVYYLP